MDQITTQLEIDDVSMELISSIVQTELIQKSALGSTISDYSSFGMPGAGSVKIPKAGSFTVEKKQGGQKANAQKLTFSSDTINFDQHAVIQGIIEDIASVQSNVPVAAEYFKRMASAHALGVDNDIYDQLKLAAAANSFNYAGGAATPTKPDFTKARQYLKNGNVPMDIIWVAINPDMEKKIMDLSDFVDADKWLSGSQAIKEFGNLPGGELSGSFIGRLYGCNVISTTVVEDDAMFFYHPSHVGIAFQMAPRLQEQYDLEYLGTRVSMDQLYGVKVLDGGLRAVKVGPA